MRPVATSASASLGRRGDRVELRGDQLGRAPGQRPAPSARPRAWRTSWRTDGPAAPAARRHAPAAPRTPRPAARTPAPPRRVPATAPRVPPAVRRPRATHTSTTPHALRDPHSAGSGLRPTILRHDPGLAASPPVRYTLRVARSGISLPSPFIVRCGRTASSRSGGPPRTAVRRAGDLPWAARRLKGPGLWKRPPGRRRGRHLGRDSLTALIGSAKANDKSGPSRSTSARRGERTAPEEMLAAVTAFLPRTATDRGRGARPQGHMLPQRSGRFGR